MDTTQASIQTYTLLQEQSDKFLNLGSVLTMMQSVADQYLPASFVISFLLLTYGTMTGFLHCERHSEKFLRVVLRAIILTSLIGYSPILAGTLQSAASALANFPVKGSFGLGDLQFDFTAGKRPDIAMIQNKLAGRSSAITNLKDTQSSPVRSFLEDMAFKFIFPPSSIVIDTKNAIKTISDYASNIAWQILFGIYLAVLLLCKAIMILMEFIQKVIIVLFGLYAPIAFAEYSIQSFKSKAGSFFLTYVGIFCWPIGWGFVNAVTLALLGTVPPPQNQSIATVIIAIVAMVPVVLWVAIGYVLAPTYAQKVVVQGGAAIQGFVGAMIADVGGQSAMFANAGMRHAADFMRKPREREGGDRSSAANTHGFDPNWGASSGNLPLPDASQMDLSQGLGSGQSQVNGSAAPRSSFSAGGANALDFGAGMIGRSGDFARLLGDSIASAAGSANSSERQTSRAFSPPGTYQQNSSSQRARNYLRRGLSDCS